MVHDGWVGRCGALPEEMGVGVPWSLKRNPCGHLAWLQQPGLLHTWSCSAQISALPPLQVPDLRPRDQDAVRRQRQQQQRQGQPTKGQLPAQAGRRAGRAQPRPRRPGPTFYVRVRTCLDTVLASLASPFGRVGCCPRTGCCTVTRAWLAGYLLALQPIASSPSPPLSSPPPPLVGITLLVLPDRPAFGIASVTYWLITHPPTRRCMITFLVAGRARAAQRAGRTLRHMAARGIAALAGTRRAPPTAGWPSRCPLGA
jgi:hypothetical protein